MQSANTLENKLLEENKIKRGKRSHRETKEENRIHIDYKRIKIVNSYFSCKQNYNLLKIFFNSVLVIFTANKN